MVPHIDAEASQRVRELLFSALPQLYVMEEASAGDQRYWIEETLRQWCDELELDLILTIGGTMPAPGPSSREQVPDATAEVLERQLPGLPEAMRAYAQEESVLALTDRSVAGIRGCSLIVNLPAGAAPACLFLEAIIDVIVPILAHWRDEIGAPKLSDVVAFPDAELVNETSGSDFANTDEALDDDISVRQSDKLDAREFAEFLQRRSSAIDT